MPVLLSMPKIQESQEALDALAKLGIPPVLLLIGVLLLLALACASGIGMWTGKKWGWFLGSFYYAYAVIRNLNALVAIPEILSALPPEELTQVTHTPAFYYAKHGVRAAIAVLLYVYFYKTNVRRYFGMARSGRWKPVAAHFALLVLISIVFATIAHVASRASFLDSELLALDALFERGEYEQVVEDASEYLAKHPDSHKGWALLGWAHSDLDSIEDARACFEKAIELEPTWDNAYVGLGVLCRKEGDLAGARTNYNKAVLLAPENAEAFSSLAVLELMEGNDAEAVEYGEKAWAVRKDDPTIAANLAVAYHYLGDTNKRDLFYKHAEELGYLSLDALQDIFDGKTSLR